MLQDIIVYGLPSGILMDISFNLYSQLDGQADPNPLVKPYAICISSAEPVIDRAVNDHKLDILLYDLITEKSKEQLGEKDFKNIRKTIRTLDKNLDVGIEYRQIVLSGDDDLVKIMNDAQILEKEKSAASMKEIHEYIGARLDKESYAKHLKNDNIKVVIGDFTFGDAASMLDLDETYVLVKRVYGRNKRVLAPTIGHETGHKLGIPHAILPIDVMSYSMITRTLEYVLGRGVFGLESKYIWNKIKRHHSKED